jgi:hypothetical protein
MLQGFSGKGFQKRFVPFARVQKFHGIGAAILKALSVIDHEAMSAAMLLRIKFDYVQVVLY